MTDVNAQFLQKPRIDTNSLMALSLFIRQAYDHFKMTFR